MCKWPTCQLSKWMVCVGMEIGHYRNKWEPVSESATGRHLGLLGGTGQARIQSKNAAPLQLWLFVQPGTQQLYCHGIYLDWLLQTIPSSLVILISTQPPTRLNGQLVEQSMCLLVRLPCCSRVIIRGRIGLGCAGIVKTLCKIFLLFNTKILNARTPPPPSPLLCVHTLQLQWKTRGLWISFNILLQLLFFRPPSLPLYPTTQVLEVFVELFAQMGSGDGLRLPVSFWSNPDHIRIAGLKISLSTGYSVVEPKKEID